jgi:hypothetical protein
VAEQSTESGLRIKLHETETPAKTSACMDRLVKEAILLLIRLHPDAKGSNSAKHGIPAPVYLGTPTDIHHANPKRHREEHAKEKTK